MNSPEKQAHAAAERRKRYAENPKPFLARNAAWTARNKVKRLAYWKARNSKPEVKARVKKVLIRDLSPQRAAILRIQKNARWHKRRALMRAVTVNPRSIQLFMSATRSKKTVTCYYCQQPTPGRTAHFDHIIPLSKGGPHSVENLCVSCPPCNQTKLNKPIQDWMRLGQQILAL